MSVWLCWGQYTEIFFLSLDIFTFVDCFFTILDIFGGLKYAAF